ncbi:MAG: hypothetical protein RMJ52_10180 [Gemmataceae bacterium]|nr:hypothetical protein [Gemmataceae bacterium]
MAQLLLHDPRIRERRNTFAFAKRRLDSARPYLNEIGSTICRHKLQNVVRIVLLHDHFDISPDERVIKRWEGDKAFIRPSADPIETDVTPYLWQVAQHPGTGDLAFMPLEFVQSLGRADGATVLTAQLANATDFLQDIATQLSKLGLSDVFGIATDHDSPSDPGLTLLETTDHASRTLTLRPVPASELPADVTETSWKFSRCADQTREINATNCVSHCISHCLGC